MSVFAVIYSMAFLACFVIAVALALVFNPPVLVSVFLGAMSVILPAIIGTIVIAIDG